MLFFKQIKTDNLSSIFGITNFCIKAFYFHQMSQINILSNHFMHVKYLNSCLTLKNIPNFLSSNVNVFLL